MEDDMVVLKKNSRDKSIWVLECNTCGCVFAYDYEDKTYNDRMECPTCGRDTYLDRCRMLPKGQHED